MRGTPEGISTALAYNRNVMHGTVKYACVEQLTEPPRSFEEAIRTHFRLQRPRILRTLEKERCMRAALPSTSSSASGKQGQLHQHGVSHNPASLQTDAYVSDQDLHQTGSVRRHAFVSSCFELEKQLAILAGEAPPDEPAAVAEAAAASAAAVSGLASAQCTMCQGPLPPQAKQKGWTKCHNCMKYGGGAGKQYAFGYTPPPPQFSFGGAQPYAGGSSKYGSGKAYSPDEDAELQAVIAASMKEDGGGGKEAAEAADLELQAALAASMSESNYHAVAAGSGVPEEAAPEDDELARAIALSMLGDQK